MSTNLRAARLSLKRMKAITLFSGGLDSILATKLMIEQGIDLEAVYFHSPLCDCERPNSSCVAAKKAADLLNIPFHKIELRQEFLDIVRNPSHGYGKNINPCIDCRILQFKKAKALMDKFGASFIVTGEVVGERPMSQKKHTIDMIEKTADLKGLVLRPLSAKLFDETLPEKEGIVDREKLFDIQGRSRKRQMELAKKFRIEEYPAPAGGCLLTNAGFSDKVRDLIRHRQLTLEYVKFLKAGRHFRLSDEVKLIMGRDEKENDRILALGNKETVFLKATDLPGPIGMLTPAGAEAPQELAASIIAYYINKAADDESIDIEFWRNNSEPHKTIATKKVAEPTLVKFRVT